MRKDKILRAEQTGYPSIDKPWLRYYSEKAIQAELPKCTMYEYLYRENRDDLDAIALNYYRKKIPYKQLFEKIDRTARAFSSYGLTEGDVITVISLHTPETIYSIYALNQIGAVVNLIYMTLDEEEILRQTVNVSSKALLYLENVREKIRNIKDDLDTKVIVELPLAGSMPFPMKQLVQFKNRKGKKIAGVIPFDKFIRNSTVEIQKAVYKQKRPAIIVYTSGTTGEPKGVLHTDDSLNAVAFQYKISDMGLNKRNRSLNAIPPFFGFGISIGIHTQLCLGIEGILQIDPDADIVAKVMMKRKPDHMVTGPAFVPAIINHCRGNMEWLKTLAGGGESISEQEEKRLNDTLKRCRADIKYVVGYGLTELGATVCTNMNRCRKSGSLGIPFPKTNVKIIDQDTQEEQKYDRTGEIWFHAPNIMKGYVNDQKETDRAITVIDDEKWLHTGDLGHLNKDGFLFFDGRIKRIYITKGNDGNIYKLFPERIENILKEHIRIDQVAVNVVSDAEKFHVAYAYITFNTGHPEDLEMIGRYLIKKLPDHVLPKAIYVLNKISMTQNGKTDYKRLGSGKVLEKLTLEGGTYRCRS